MADTTSWRTQLRLDDRNTIVQKIVLSVKKTCSSSNLNEKHLKDVAGQLENKCYTSATSKDDYFKRISSRLLALEQQQPQQSQSPLLQQSGSTSNPVSMMRSRPQNQVIVSQSQPPNFNTLPQINSCSGNRPTPSCQGQLQHLRQSQQVPQESKHMFRNMNPISIPRSGAASIASVSHFPSVVSPPQASMRNLGPRQEQPLQHGNQHGSFTPAQPRTLSPMKSNSTLDIGQRGAVKPSGKQHNQNQVQSCSQQLNDSPKLPISSLQRPPVAAPSQSSNLFSIVPSPTPLKSAPSPLVENPEKQTTEPPQTTTTPEIPISPTERLMKGVQSMSRETLRGAVTDRWSVAINKVPEREFTPTSLDNKTNESLIETRAGISEEDGNLTEAHPSKISTPDTLFSPVECMLKEFESMSPRTFGMWSDLMWTLPGSEALTRKRPESSDLEFESDATTRIKRPKVSTEYALLEEIKEINQRLIETVAEIIEEDFNGRTIVKLTYTPVGSKNMKQYTWTERLLVPKNYPKCSPTLMDKLLVDKSNLCADLSHGTRSRFSRFLHTLPQPMSLTVMIKAWNDCAHAVMADYAKRNGGGTAFGTWQQCTFA